jgi:hypothetical protein
MHELLFLHTVRSVVRLIFITALGSNTNATFAELSNSIGNSGSSGKPRNTVYGYEIMSNVRTRSRSDQETQDSNRRHGIGGASAFSFHVGHRDV